MNVGRLKFGPTDTLPGRISPAPMGSTSGVVCGKADEMPQPASEPIRDYEQADASGSMARGAGAGSGLGLDRRRFRKVSRTLSDLSMYRLQMTA